MQTRTKLQTSTEGVLNGCKLQFISKIQKKKSTMVFTLKTLFPKFLHQVWFISFSVDYAINLLRRI